MVNTYSTGAAFTRFQTLRLRQVFPEALADQLISYGSCQFPTLGFVVERYKQVQAFVPEPFWRIKGATSRMYAATDRSRCCHAVATDSGSVEAAAVRATAVVLVVVKSVELAVE